MNCKALAMLALGMLALGMLGAAPAVALDGGLFDLAARWPNCVAKTCCDDYCPKPMPRVCKNGRFCCDNYCPKPEPCARPVCCCCCDNYCRKPLPPIQCPCSPHLSCGAPARNMPNCGSFQSAGRTESSTHQALDRSQQK
jgi:hypothetical protein